MKDGWHSKLKLPAILPVVLMFEHLGYQPAIVLPYTFFTEGSGKPHHTTVPQRKEIL